VENMGESRYRLKETEVYVLRMLKERELQLQKSILLVRASLKDVLESYAARSEIPAGDLSVAEESDGYWMTSTPSEGSDNGVD